jgi:hypothetical protein
MEGEWSRQFFELSTSRLAPPLRHPAAQPLADLLDRVLGGGPAHPIEPGLRGVLQHVWAGACCCSETYSDSRASSDAFA